MKFPNPRLASLVALSAFITPFDVSAANSNFQDFFFQACSNPVAGLAARCGETNGGLGDLSGDSESSLNPSQNLSTSSGNLSSARSRNEQAREHGDQVRGYSTSDGDRISIGPFSLLLNGRYAQQKVDRDTDLERSFDLDVYGAQLGLDKRITDALVAGVWLHWGSSDLEYASEVPGRNFEPMGSAGEVNGDSLGASIFLSSSFAGGGYLDVSLGYMAHEFDIERRALFQESNRVVTTTRVVTEASTDSDEWWGVANVGYNINRGSLSFAPYASIAFSNNKTDGYLEEDLSGSGLAMAVDDSELDSTSAAVGFLASISISTSSFVLLPQLRVEYVRQLDRAAPEAGVSFINDSAASQFLLQGERVDSDRVDLSVGASAIFPNGLIGFVDVQGSFAVRDVERYSVSVGIRREF